MIYCLTGELIELDALAMTAVIDCCGVGYKVAITGNTLTKLSQPAAAKEKTRLYTYMAVREDAVELYGFYTTEEMDTYYDPCCSIGSNPSGGCKGAVQGAGRRRQNSRPYRVGT